MDMTAILEELKDHGFGSYKTARKVAAVNATLQDVASRELWPVLLKTVDLTFLADQVLPNNYPTDVIAIHNVWKFPSRRVLPHRRIDDLYPNTNFPPSLFWTMRGKDLMVYGPPGTGNQVSMEYFARPAAVDVGWAETGIWLPPQFHNDVLMYGTLFRLYLFDDDLEIARTFEILYEKAIQNARLNLHMLHLEDDYIHVLNPDDYHDDT